MAKFIKMFEDVIAPERATLTSAGFDIRAYLIDRDKDSSTYGEKLSKILIKPKQRVKIGSGLKFELRKNSVMFLVPRSSCGIKKNLVLQNTIGVIDSDFRGELMMFLENTSETETIEILHNERICQAVILNNFDAILEETTELTKTERGEGGFGSSGRM